MSDQTKQFTPPVPLPEELKQPGRKVEHFEVRIPSPLEVASMRDYPAAVMRAVALAANEAGLDGKRLDGFAMVENGVSPRIVFQVSSAEVRDHAEGAHQCKCEKIHSCPIFTHPDTRVQEAIADLAEEMARYDETTGNISTLVFHTDYAAGGAFHSETINTKARSRNVSRSGG